MLRIAALNVNSFFKICTLVSMQCSKMETVVIR